MLRKLDSVIAKCLERCVDGTKVTCPEGGCTMEDNTRDNSMSQKKRVSFFDLVQTIPM